MSLVRRELDKEFPHIQLLSARSSIPPEELLTISQLLIFSQVGRWCGCMPRPPRSKVLVEVNLGAYFILIIKCHLVPPRLEKVEASSTWG